MLGGHVQLTILIIGDRPMPLDMKFSLPPVELAVVATSTSHTEYPIEVAYLNVSTPTMKLRSGYHFNHTIGFDVHAYMPDLTLAKNAVTDASDPSTNQSLGIGFPTNSTSLLSFMLHTLIIDIPKSSLASGNSTPTASESDSGGSMTGMNVSLATSTNNITLGVSMLPPRHDMLW